MTVSREEWYRINDTMAEWQVKVCGPDGASYQDAFEAWLSEHPAHRRAYTDLTESEREAGLTSLPKPALHAAGTHFRPRVSRPGVKLLAAVTATFLMLTGGTAVVRYVTAAPANPLGTGYAASDRIREIALPDGSTMVLDAHSVMRVSYAGGVPALELMSGRARFAPRDGRDDPFVVSTNSLRATAHGGLFDMSLASGTVKIVALAKDVVIEGRDTISPGNGSLQSSIRLAAGHKLLVQGKEVHVMPTDRSDAHWTAALLPLDGLTLGEVIGIGNAAGGTPIVLGDPTLSGLKLQGQLTAVDTRSLARQLAAAFDLDVHQNMRGYVLARKR